MWEVFVDWGSYGLGLWAGKIPPRLVNAGLPSRWFVYAVIGPMEIRWMQRENDLVGAA